MSTLTKIYWDNPSEEERTLYEDVLQIQMCLKRSLDWLACWSPYMSQQHCVVNDLYTLTLRRCSTWRWLLHPWGVIPSLHISLSSSFVYQCFCRSTASGAVLWSFPGPKNYVRPVLRESWRCRWDQDEHHSLTSNTFCRHPASACYSVSVGFTERVLTPSSQKHTASDYSTYAASSWSTQWKNIWNIRKGKTQGEMSKLFSLLTIYLHPFTLFTNRKNHKNTNYLRSRTTKSNKTKRDPSERI